MQQEQAVIASWVNTYTSKLYQWAYTKVRDKEIAEDLVQDTFMAALESYEKYKGESQPLTWLFGILNNKINEHFRKLDKKPLILKENLEDDEDYFFNKKGHWMPNTVPSPWHAEAQLLDNPKFLSLLNQCLKKLPGSWSEILLAKFLLEKKSAIICQDYQISETNYWQIIHRAKLTMRDCIDQNWRD
jgi:RNA polymerase sigma-70 factor (ECF subfamily)